MENLENRELRAIFVIRFTIFTFKLTIKSTGNENNLPTVKNGQYRLCYMFQS